VAGLTDLDVTAVLPCAHQVYLGTGGGAVFRWDENGTEWSLESCPTPPQSIDLAGEQPEVDRVKAAPICSQRNQSPLGRTALPESLSGWYGSGVVAVREELSASW